MSAIGIFDSGVGGLSIWKEIKKLLPQAPLIYFADQERCPYGDQSYEDIQTYAFEITEFLLAQGCQLIVVACNSATTSAIQALRQQYPHIPFVGIEPAVKPAALLSKTKQVGVLATDRTLQSTHFKTTANKYADSVQYHLQAGYELAELVEGQMVRSPKMESLLRQYLEPMKEAGIDQLVLGCTHYPFFQEQAQEILGGEVNIINPAQAVATQTLNLVKQHQLKFPMSINDCFYTSGNLDSFQCFIKEQEFTQKESRTATANFQRKSFIQ